jgi:KDO2-lipid IV(A) lauroyltransferase
MKSLLDYIALTLTRLLIGLIRFLPPRASFVLVRACISLLCLFIPRLKRIARKNLELVFPKYSHEKREKILNASIGALAEYFIDYAKIPDLANKEIRVELSGQSNWEDIEEAERKAEGVGTMFITAHFGCFESGAQAWAKYYKPVGILARDFGLPKLNRWWNSRREIFGNKVFSRRGGYKEIERRLRLGNSVTFLVDQNVKRNHAVFVDFFGISAATTKTVAVAALRTKAPMFFLAPLRREGDVFYLNCTKIIDADTLDGSVDEKIRIITQDLSHALENIIRQYPEQWFWMHRRFKTRPMGEPENIYTTRN